MNKNHSHNSVILSSFISGALLMFSITEAHVNDGNKRYRLKSFSAFRSLGFMSSNKIYPYKKLN